MAIFMIETDAVSSGASSLSSIASQITSIASAVSGYDTSCEDFDFGSAKSAIASNIEACATKVTNTSNVLNDVVTSHTTLQNSLKFDAAPENKNDKSGTEDTGKKVGDDTSGSPASGSPYSGGGSPYSGGGSPSGGGGYTPITPVTPSTSAPETTPETTPKGPVDISTKVDGIKHDKVDKSKLDSVGKNIFESGDLKYNAAGYATIGGMFVISCGKAFGNVGDELLFTLKDGQTFKCIIGQIDESNGGNIKFFVNDSWKENGQENFQTEIGSYITKIQNYGTNTKYALGASVNSALDWAKATAADNSHGYSQQTRWGNPNYDCSSFVISSYEAAGIKVKEAGASYTGNMKNAFTKVGFKWIPGTPDVNSLQPGDVLLNEGTHTEMYIGDGKMIGAHGNSDGRDGDSSGGEISITKYSNKSWDGVLRYVGSNPSTATATASTIAVPTAPRVKVETLASTTNTNDDQNDQNEDNKNAVEV